MSTIFDYKRYISLSPLEDENRSPLSSLEDVAMVSMMYLYLHDWFLLSPSDEDTCWVVRGSTPSTFVTMDGFGMSTSDLLPQTTLLTEEMTDRDTTHTVKLILRHCSPDALKEVIERLRESSDKLYLVKEEDLDTLLPESLPSLEIFTKQIAPGFVRDGSRLLRERLESLPQDDLERFKEIAAPVLETELKEIHLPLPPVHIPRGAAEPYFPDDLMSLHARYSSAHQIKMWLGTTPPRELYPTFKRIHHLYLLREHFNQKKVRHLYGTSHLHELYKALYPKEEWIDYSNRPLTENVLGLEQTTYQRMFKYIVPEPNYNQVNVSTYQPYFSARDMPHFQSHHWGQRKLLLNEILYFTLLVQRLGCVMLYIIYAGAAPSDHIMFLSSLFPTFRFILVDPAKWNPEFIKKDSRLGSSNFSPFGPKIVINEKITVYHQFFTDDLARSLRDELKNNIKCFISDIRPTDIDSTSKDIEEREETILENMEMQRRWYEIIRGPDDEMCWGMFKFRPSFTQPMFKYLSGQLYYQPWAPLKSSELRLITNQLDMRYYNNRWLEQHMVWYNENKRNSRQEPSSRKYNDLWDTQFEHDILELYRTCVSCGDPSVNTYERMKQISAHLNHRDMYHKKYCFEAGYEVNPTVRDKWIHKLISKTKQFYSTEEQLATDTRVVDHIYKICIFRPPQNVTSDQRAGWELKKKKELTRILGLYCYDHIKYDLIRNWLARHHLLSDESDGISSTHETRRAHARVNEITKAMDLADPKFVPRRVLDFGGNKGFVASVFGEKFRLERSNVVVTDVESWYGHRREQTFPNVTYMTMSNQRLPFEDNDFDTVFVLMVLHHVEQLTTALNELYRVMKPGGLLFLREHDTRSTAEKQAVDIEHSTFELVQHAKNKHEALQYLSSYKGFYRSIEEWTDLFREHHFELVSGSGLEEDASGWTRYTLRVYRKSK